MESIMLTVKFVTLYGLTVFVVTVVGATVIMGLYQLIRNQVGGADKVGKRHVSSSAVAQKNG